MAPPVLNTPNVRNCFIRDHDFRNILCASASMIAPRSGVRNCFIRIMTLAIFFAPPVLILLTSNKKPTAGSRCAKRSDLRGVQGLSILAFVSHQLKLNWACGYLRAFLWNQTFEAKIMKGIIPQYSLRLRTCLAISFAPPQKERMSQYPLSLVQRTKTRDQMSKEYCERILTGRSHLLGKENGVASNPSRMNLLHDSNPTLKSEITPRAKTREVQWVVKRRNFLCSVADLAKALGSLYYFFLGGEVPVGICLPRSVTYVTKPIWGKAEFLLKKAHLGVLELYQGRGLKNKT